MRTWILTLAIVCGLALGTARAEDALFWTAQTISDKVSATAGDLCLQIDANDQPHVAWFYGKDRDLMYATRVEKAWVTEAVDTEGSVGLDASLRVDAANVPHISYTDETTKQLKHAWKVDGAWHTETVYQGKKVRLGTALQIAADGHLWIACYDQGPGDLLLADKAADAKDWTLTTVSSDGDEGLYPQMVLDAAGRPAILYEGDGPGGTPVKVTGNEDLKGDAVIKLARLGADGTWAIQRLPVGGGQFHMNLLRTAEGEPVATVLLHDGAGLRLLSGGAAGWTSETICKPATAGKLAGESHSSGILSDGRVMVYFTNEAKQPTLAVKSEGEWTLYPISRTDKGPLLMLGSAMSISPGDWTYVAIFQPQKGLVLLGISSLDFL